MLEAWPPSAPTAASTSALFVFDRPETIKNSSLPQTAPPPPPPPPRMAVSVYARALGSSQKSHKRGEGGGSSACGSGSGAPECVGEGPQTETGWREVHNGLRDPSAPPWWVNGNSLPPRSRPWRCWEVLGGGHRAQAGSRTDHRCWEVGLGAVARMAGVREAGWSTGEWGSRSRSPYKGRAKPRPPALKGIVRQIKALIVSSPPC